MAIYWSSRSNRKGDYRPRWSAAEWITLAIWLALGASLLVAVLP